MPYKIQNKSKIVFFITVLLLGLPNVILSQDCHGYHKNKICSSKSEPGFNPYSQSRSALFEIDSTFAYELIFYGKKDYILTICTERGYDPVHFRILEKGTGNVFYDNMTEGYNNSIGFTIDAPQKVILEITLLAEEIEPDNFSENRVCVGVNIQWRKVKKLGF